MKEPTQETVQRVSQLAAKQGLKVWCSDDTWIKTFRPGFINDTVHAFSDWDHALAFFERLEYPIHDSGSTS